MSAVLPYEVHVTIDPVLDIERRSCLWLIAEKYLFKVDGLEVKDTPVYDSSMTGRFGDMAQAKTYMGSLKTVLVKAGFKLRREKIELILHDERYTR